MRKVLLAAVGLLICGAIASDADAQVVVHVSKSRQTMYVYVDGYLEHEWPVSTARGGYSTPSGTYRPTGFDPYHRSSRYNNAPMPHSIFFHGGYAIHGTYDIYRLGSPASHGCIRLHPQDAAELYGLVRESGDTRIIVSH
jgi:lipoprotein-anchoring transpeptidase ErfK/SrfK